MTDTLGRTYIDGLSGVFTTSLGHANTEIIDAVTAQLGRLAFGAPTMATTSTALELVDRILEFAPPPYTTMKFLSGGSEATESAMKLARQYHRQSGQMGRYKILSHYRGYHGGTGHALAASGWPTWKIPFEPMAPGFVHLHTPDPDSPPTPVPDQETAARLYLELVRETIEFEGPDTVAAIITEPIMMSAGVVVPPDSYLRGLRELCDRHGILLIFDEIITGFGRTGTWFAAEHSGAWPDIICCGKGVTGGYSPLSIVLMTDKIAASFWGEPEEMIQFFAGHTYGGNPVACSAALATIDYIVRHGVIGQVVENGGYLRARLEDLRASPPEHPAGPGPGPPAGDRVHRRSPGMSAAASTGSAVRSRRRLAPEGCSFARRHGSSPSGRHSRRPGRSWPRSSTSWTAPSPTSRPRSASEREAVRRACDPLVDDDVTDGPRPTVLQAGAEWHRAAKVPGSTVAMFIDPSVPGADLYGGLNVLAPGATIPVHWHSIGELQFILSGTGLTIDRNGDASAIGPHSVIFAPAGRDGAHGFTNTGLVPLTILFVYPSPGGVAPDFNLLEDAAE